MKTKSLAIAFFITLCTTIGIIAWQPDPAYVDYVVDSGDTLWSIAEQSDIDTDKRAIVAYMIDKSNLHNPGDLKPGMIVRIPMQK
ncbi:putative glycosyl hydrolase [Paenibacillus sp. TCA20]|uniref:LysM peptidoglycan-binding domain-containing protein n=1 Tax=Paenibacillus urinalis TaxID=521520 RepID=A0ABY7XHK5_9BACL|nr:MULTISPECIES: LysM peptidoglycan-binding domain-containing protein [Paenibacillus]WDI05184.1 LysM peptidoglycan-binding domain-containing protein [Paenibacillus urinalis]GAK41989.1 putative glycosyl hydrolase [Paenibacillus sp. TCA20]